MQVYINDPWLIFCIAFGVILITNFIMFRQGRNFYTMDVVLRKFNITDLELPSSVKELPNLINGIFALPDEKKRKTLSTLKTQLYVDFIFIPAAYSAIFLLCMNVSHKMTLGKELFAALAWLQVISFVLDIIENIYLLTKIHPALAQTNKSEHLAFQIIEIIKWGLALIAIVCSVSAIIYFWLVGRYSIESLKYLLIIIIELIVFITAMVVSKKNKISEY